MKKIILIDGTNFLFRSFYATSVRGATFTNSKGLHTNALYGFIMMINKVLEEEKPEYVVVAFDKGKTFRHDKYDDYKGGRNKTPDELKEQIPYVKNLVRSMGLFYVDCDNYEADDIIGTYALKANEDKDLEALIISSDKDLLQLIKDDIHVKLLKMKDYIYFDQERFKKEYGFEPLKMIDLKALMGDSSDNIPGVKGIGEKTAIKLLNEYGSLDLIYENIDSIKGKIKEKLITYKSDAYKSYELAKIVNDVPIDTSLEKTHYKGFKALEYLNILQELEFTSIIRKLDLTKMNEEKEDSYILVKGMKDVKIESDFSIYIETLGTDYHLEDSKIINVSLKDKNNTYVIPWEVFKEEPCLLKSDYHKYTYDIKRMLVILKRENIEITNLDFDLMLGFYLLNEEVKDDISYIMNNKGYLVPFYEELFKKKEIVSADRLNSASSLKARFIYEYYDKVRESLKEEDALKLFEEIEIPLSYVLSEMEEEGIRVDYSYLDNLNKEVEEKMKLLEKKIYSLANEEFNISSFKQLGIILFEKLNIPYPRKKKGDNYSTDKKVLNEIRSYHEIVPLVEEYRSLSKLKSSFIDGLSSSIIDGKIHTTYNQALTRTGRLSSSNPNLQNIPIRDDYAKMIRKAFRPEEGSLLLSADYSQIELRVFASLAHASNMIKAFQEGKDIHKITAAEIYHKEISDVTKEERRNAKAVNFGIIYGISSFGLGEDLNISRGEAKNFIDHYLETFPEIKEYMDSMTKYALEHGYVKTIMKRKRTIPELKSNNYIVREQGKRMALNTPIQGSSADILKKAMIDLNKELKKNNYKSKMLLQIHDELVLNVYKDELDDVKKMVKEAMENVYKLKVPLEVDISTGSDLYEAK